MLIKEDLIELEEWLKQSKNDISLISSFDCGIEGINNYIINKTDRTIKKDYNNEKLFNTTTTLFIKNKDLIGFYDLKNSSIIHKPDNKLRGLPSVEVSYIAVNKKYQNKGYGKKLLMSIIAEVFQYSLKFSCCRFIYLHSLVSCTGFYEKCKFHEFGEYFGVLHDDCVHETVQMYYPITKI